MSRLVLVDGHSILNRAFYGIPDLTNSKGLHTNAVYGFLNIMFKILEEGKTDHLAVTFDLKEPTFRHEIYDDYKGARRPIPEELHQQVQVMKDVLATMRVPIMTLSGFGANDVLGAIAKGSQARGIDISVAPDDRDLLQLADEHIKIHIPKTSKADAKIKDYYPEDVKRKYQVTPVEFIDIKALMGDTSGNIPGVPSIGEKTATSLIVACGSIENCYSHLDEIKLPKIQRAPGEHYDMARMSRKLAAICLDHPVEFRYEGAEIGSLYAPEVYQYTKRLEFKSLLARFGASAMENSSESNLEEHFFLIKGKKEAERIFARASKCQVAGLWSITGRNTAAAEAAE